MPGSARGREFHICIPHPSSHQNLIIKIVSNYIHFKRQNSRLRSLCKVSGNFLFTCLFPTLDCHPIESRESIVFTTCSQGQGKSQAQFSSGMALALSLPREFPDPNPLGRAAPPKTLNQQLEAVNGKNIFSKIFY